MFLRSIDSPRNIESMEYLLYGFYPPINSTSSSSSSSVDAILFHVVEQEAENSDPNTILCPALQKEFDRLEKQQEYLDYLNKVSIPLKKEISKILNQPLNSISINEFGDTFNCLVCHNKSFPIGVNSSLVQQFLQANDWETNYRFNSSKVVSYSCSTFYQEWINFFDSIISNSSSAPKFVLYSASDTALRVFLTGLGSFNGIWPPYCSHLEVGINFFYNK